MTEDCGKREDDGRLREADGKMTEHYTEDYGKMTEDYALWEDDGRLREAALTLTFNPIL